MFNVIDGLKIDDRPECHHRVKHQCLHTIEIVNGEHEKQRGKDTKHRIISEECLSLLLLIIVNSKPRISDAPNYKLINILPFFRSRRVHRCCNLIVMPIQMMVCEMHVVQLRHVKRPKYSIKLARLVHHLVSYGKLSRIEV